MRVSASLSKSAERDLAVALYRLLVFATQMPCTIGALIIRIGFLKRDTIRDTIRVL